MSNTNRSFTGKRRRADNDQIKNESQDIARYFIKPAKKPKLTGESPFSPPLPNTQPQATPVAVAQPSGKSTTSLTGFQPRMAVVSADPIEDLRNVTNIRRRELFLEDQGRKKKQPGQFKGGKVDDPVLFLSDCESCKTRTKQWMLDAYSADKSSEDKEEKQASSYWYFGSEHRHFQVRLAVPDYVSNEVEKQTRMPYLIQIISKRKYKKDIIRKLRWISTVAFAWLRVQGNDPTEVQAAYDGEKYWFTENKDKLAKALKKFTWRDVIHDDFIGKACTAFADNQRFIERLKRHRQALIDEDFCTKVPTIHVPEWFHDQHAETKLIDYFLSRCVSPFVKSSPRTITVAGIRRPCFVCFARLQAARAKFLTYGWDLVHKNRPGPFWPTDDAFKNIQPEERELLAKNLLSGWHMYVNGPMGYDRKSGLRTADKRKLGAKSETWNDLDTDSGGEWSDDDENLSTPKPTCQQSMVVRSREDEEKAERWQMFLQALENLPRVVPVHPARPPRDGTSSSNAIEIDEDEPENKCPDNDNGLSDIYAAANDKQSDARSWGFTTLANDGGGDCLFHALEGRNLNKREVLDLRTAVSQQQNRIRLQPNAVYDVSQALLQSNSPYAWPQDLQTVPDHVYRLMQAIPEIYAGDDEINQWCTYRKMQVFEVSSDDEVRQFDANTRKRVDGDQETIKALLKVAMEQGAVILWKIPGHFERVTAIDVTGPHAAEQGQQSTASQDTDGDTGSFDLFDD